MSISTPRSPLLRTATHLLTAAMLYTPLTHARISGMEIVQTLPTQSGYDWEPFTIDGTLYLAGANYSNVTNRNIDSPIYRWDGSAFVLAQKLATHGAVHWENFTIDGTPYLAVANYHNGTSFNIDSAIYRWDGTAFSQIQTIPTQGARDWEFFSIDGTPYLAVANNYDGTTVSHQSKIYRWNGAAFVEFQSIPSLGARNWEFFTIDGERYLGLANARSDSSHAVDSVIYRWDGGQFTEYQTIPTTRGADMAFFTIGTTPYLAIAQANTGDGSSNLTDSLILRWDGTRFVQYQTIPTSGAFDWESFERDGETYLAVSNFRNDSSYRVDSTLYRWQTDHFVAALDFPTQGALDTSYFVADGTPYLAVAEYNNDTTGLLQSPIYRLTETFAPQAVATATPSSGSAPLTVQLDAGASSDPDGGAITNYQWLTSDVQSASGATSSFTFTQPGSYSIQLTVTDDEGQSASTTVDIQVDAADVANCEGRASYSAVTGELHLPLMEVATVPLLGGVNRPAGETTVPAAATLRIIPGTTLFEIQSVLSATPDNDPAVTPCHARYTIDGVLDVPRVDVPVVTAIGGLTITTGVDTYQATLEQVPMSDLFQLTGITLIP